MPAAIKTTADSDHDNDVGAPGDDTNNNQVLRMGHAADSADRDAVTHLVERYYTAALAKDGVKACSMLYSTLEESVPEDYGISPPSEPYMKGSTCPTVLHGLFQHFHAQLAVEYPKLHISHVRLVEHHGVAVLTFGTMPERQIPIVREGHTWRLVALLDSELP